MSSLRPVLCFFLIQISKCYSFNENVPFLDYYITSTNLLNFYNISDMERNINDKLLFEVKFDDSIAHKIAVRLKNVEVVNWKTNFSVYRENTEDTDLKTENFDLVEGFIISKQHTSSVVGYLKHTYFYGTIFFGKYIYYIEDLNNYLGIFDKYRNSEYNAVIYKESSLKLPIIQNYDEEHLDLFNKNVNFIMENSEKNLYKSIIGNGKVCSLLVLMDNAFLRIHNNDMKSAVAQILTSIEEANSLFRSTDFDDDGYPDNIGFIIKYFIVIQSEKSPMNMFPRNTNTLMPGDAYLNTFSQYKLLKEVCLGIAFTGNTFKNNVLGASYTAGPTERDFLKYSLGGICDRPYKFQTGRNLNTLVISPKLKNGNTVPQYIFDLSVAHELGHSFGSNHDVSKACVGHLMTASTPEDNQRKRFLFSSCSKTRILRSILSKGHCFESYDSSFCGNGIVESGENCDCGTIRDCQYFDVCCTPRGQKNSCKVDKSLGYDCHPSQGMCCTAKCKYKDLSNFDLECKNFEKTCPCEEKSGPCTCGIGGKCTGNICSSEECARISLLECDCPKNIASNKCKICCLYNNSCLSASFLSEKLIDRNKTLLTHLKLLQIKKEIKSDKLGYHKELGLDNSSLSLYFREVNANDYCLLYGKLGICNTSFNCVTPSDRQVFPILHIRGTGNSCKQIFVIYHALLFGFVSLPYL